MGTLEFGSIRGVGRGGTGIKTSTLKKRRRVRDDGPIESLGPQADPSARILIPKLLEIYAFERVTPRGSGGSRRID